jgi:hypothetical protein
MSDKRSNLSSSLDSNVRAVQSSTNISPGPLRNATNALFLLNTPGKLAMDKVLPTLAECALEPISPPSCSIGSIANPHLNNDLGTIIMFPGETSGLSHLSLIAMRIVDGNLKTTFLHTPYREMRSHLKTDERVIWGPGCPLSRYNLEAIQASPWFDNGNRPSRFINPTIVNEQTILIATQVFAGVMTPANTAKGTIEKGKCWTTGLSGLNAHRHMDRFNLQFVPPG